MRTEVRGDASTDLGRKGRGIKKKCMIIVSVLLLAVIPLSVLGAALFGDELSSAVYEGEGFVSRSLQRISGNADETSASGHVSRGNNYRTGDPQMEVVLTREPTETLYLKGFSGGVYSDGEWEPADDEEIFLSVAVSLHWDAWRSWVASMFQNMYFVMNGLSVVQEISEPGVIYIIPYNGRSDITYIPYYSGWMNSWWGEQPGYGFQYFEQHEMNVRWNHVWQGYERMSQWYRQISLRRKAMKRKLESQTCRNIFAGYMDMIHEAGYLREFGGMEEQFPDRLSETLPPVTKEEAVKMRSIAARSAFGRTEPDEADRQFLLMLYYRTAGYLDDELSGSRKMKFRYIRAFY